MLSILEHEIEWFNKARTKIPFTITKEISTSEFGNKIYTISLFSEGKSKISWSAIDSINRRQDFEDAARGLLNELIELGLKNINK